MKNASFIYTVKNGPTCEFKFHAKNEDDLAEKAALCRDLAGEITGSIFGWIDDPSLDYYRDAVTISQ